MCDISFVRLKGVCHTIAVIVKTFQEKRQKFAKLEKKGEFLFIGMSSPDARQALFASGREPVNREPLQKECT
jgi:hypothetical protein